MPSLLTPYQLTSAELLDATRSSLGLLAASAAQANRMVSILLNLDNSALQDWLNSQPMDDVFELFDAHAISGAATNQALATTAIQLSDSGVPSGYNPVDVRPFQDKLAEQQRKVEIVDGKFIVSNIQ